MASPISKLRSFSRLLGSVSPKPAASRSFVFDQSLFPLSPRANSSVLGPSVASSVRTPQTPSNSPGACSTPILSTYNAQIRRDSEYLKEDGDYGVTPVKRSTKMNISPYRYLALGSRKRHLGVSDSVSYKQKPKRQRSKDRLTKALSPSCVRRCSVFSTSVAPSNSPRNTGKVFRLSGVALSPTTVSWASKSPVQFVAGAADSPGSGFRWSSSSRSLRLERSVEQCPPGMLYFWEDDEAELETSIQLGRGGFGRVFEGNYRGQKVAIKKLENVSKSRQAILETMQGEMNGLRLNHVNIVRTLVVIQPIFSPETKNACYVVMEHAGKRNLSHIINDSDEVIEKQRIIRFASDILKGLAYLHQHRLAHLDLKPSNVIVTSEDECKICDFGSCLSLSPKLNQHNLLGSRSGIGMDMKDGNTSQASDSIVSSSTSGLSTQVSLSSTGSAHSSSCLMGTFVYRAPELLRGLWPTTKADIYSLGITAWQLWSRTLPYAGQHNHATVFSVVAFGARPKIPDFPDLTESVESGTSLKKYFDVVSSCWNTDPEIRPSAEQALALLAKC